MATTFKIKRFSTKALQEAATDVYYKELAPKGEKLAAKVKRVSGNAGRWVKHNPKTTAAVVGGTALTSMAIGGGIKGHKEWKAKKTAEKTFSIPRMFSDDQKKGMGLGTKLLVSGTALAGGVAAAKTGMLGKSAKLGINKAQFGLGKAVGSKGLMKNAVQGQREALGKVKVPKVTPSTSTPLALPAHQNLLPA